jgi:hypothetical protein
MSSRHTQARGLEYFEVHLVNGQMRLRGRLPAATRAFETQLPGMSAITAIEAQFSALVDIIRRRTIPWSPG